MPEPEKKNARNCRQTTVESNGIMFLSCKGSKYISLNYHRSASRTRYPKSIWKISRPDECHTLCEAEIGNWQDKHGNYWSISRDGQIELGTRGERVAFFDSPQNKTDPWHGYPVGSRRGLPIQRRPPDDLLKAWHDSNWISFTTYSRLITGRL
jgi:hypothetical protein